MPDIKHLPSIDRPRERLLAIGRSNLSVPQLLAVILNSGYQHHSAVDLAKQILQQHPLSKLGRLKPKQLMKIKGIGPAKACRILACLELSYRLNHNRSLSAVNSPEKVFQQLAELRHKKQERCVVLYLNGRQQLIEQRLVTLGSINTNYLDLRAVFAPALTLPAHSIILTHNHPSGDCQPSQDDLVVTDRVQEAGQILGVTLTDHVIIGHNHYFSFKQEGMLEAD